MENKYIVRWYDCYLLDQKGSNGAPESTMIRSNAYVLNSESEANKLIEKVIKDCGWYRPYTKKDFVIERL